jgi:glycosyltransferase involved in cell wall biosynthesis
LLKQQGFEIQLAIAGEDEFGGTGYHKDLEALIQQLDLSHSVKLLGAVSEETIMSFLEQAHVYTLASLHEPLGVAIMEAMAMELPVVVTGAGGVKELVDDGISGVLVPPEDPAALASAIANVLKNPTLALNLSHQARQRVMTEFSYHRSAEVLTECLRNLP